MKPKFSFGVRSHILLIRGVRPVPTVGLLGMPFDTMPVLELYEFGERCVECDGRRMKSTRAACSGSYIGSLICRATWPKSPEYFFSFWDSRRLLISHIRPMAPSAPMTRPGKRPAANDFPSKPGFTGTGTGQPDVCDEDAGLVADGVEVADDVGVAVRSLEHMPLLHV